MFCTILYSVAGDVVPSSPSLSTEEDSRTKLGADALQTLIAGCTSLPHVAMPMLRLETLELCQVTLPPPLVRVAPFPRGLLAHVVGPVALGV